MNYTEFSQRFDVLYNNITSNQAPGLNEYEKSVFLTKGQDEYIKNQFYALSNPKKAGYDNSRKRYTDFAGITKTVTLPQKSIIEDDPYKKFDPRAYLFYWPEDVMFVINEQLRLQGQKYLPLQGQEMRQVIPISYDEYNRLMSRPFKQPNKYQAWRLITEYRFKIEETDEENQKEIVEKEQPLVEVILNKQDDDYLQDGSIIYFLRYIRIPNPIITEDLSTYGTYVDPAEEESEESEEEINNRTHSILTIRGKSEPSNCELHESTHEEILQRAVELAKLAWEGTSQAAITGGQRSE